MRLRSFVGETAPPRGPVTSLARAGPPGPVGRPPGGGVWGSPEARRAARSFRAGWAPSRSSSARRRFPGAGRSWASALARAPATDGKRRLCEERRAERPCRAADQPSHSGFALQNVRRGQGHARGQRRGRGSGQRRGARTSGDGAAAPGGRRRCQRGQPLREAPDPGHDDGQHPGGQAAAGPRR